MKIKYGLGLSNIEIKKIVNRCGIKINGIYSKDELPSRLKKGFYIINLQSSNDGSGTHWTGVYIDNECDLYFDSEGFVPPSDLEGKLSFPYYYNTFEIQNENAKSCGYWVLGFIIALNTSRNKFDGYVNFLKKFVNNTTNDENDLKKMFKCVKGIDEIITM